MFSGGMYSCKHISRESSWEGHIGQNVVQVNYTYSKSYSVPCYAQLGLSNLLNKCKFHYLRIHKKKKKLWNLC